MESIKQQLESLGIASSSNKNQEESGTNSAEQEKNRHELLIQLEEALIKGMTLSAIKNIFVKHKIRPETVKLMEFLQIYKNCITRNEFDDIQLQRWVTHLDLESLIINYEGKKALTLEFKRAARKMCLDFNETFINSAPNSSKPNKIKITKTFSEEVGNNSPIDYFETSIDEPSYEVVLQPGDDVFDIRKIKWKIKRFHLTNGVFKVGLRRLNIDKTVYIHQIRTLSGKALRPGTSYKLVLGNSVSKFSMSFEYIGKYKPKYIEIVGDSYSSRIINRKPLKDLQCTIACCTNHEFDTLPEIIKIAVNDDIEMRKDWAADHYWGSIEFQGQKGTVVSISRGGRGLFSSTCTIKARFNDVLKNYSLHRVIDNKGSMFCIGWTYEIKIDSNTLVARPKYPSAEDRISIIDARKI